MSMQDRKMTENLQKGVSIFKYMRYSNSNKPFPISLFQRSSHCTSDHFMQGRPNPVPMQGKPHQPRHSGPSIPEPHRHVAQTAGHCHPSLAGLLPGEAAQIPIPSHEFGPPTSAVHLPMHIHRHRTAAPSLQAFKRQEHRQHHPTHSAEQHGHWHVQSNGH